MPVAVHIREFCAYGRWWQGHCPGSRGLL